MVNLLVQAALVPWVAERNSQTMFGVLRQCATGELLLDATDSTIADPAKPFQRGERLSIGSEVDKEGKRLLVAFTDNARLALYRQNGGSTTPPISFAQPAAATLQMAATQYDGIAIDSGSPGTAFIAYAAEIRGGLTDDAALNEALKTAIVAQRPRSEIIDLANASPTIFIGVSIEKNAQGETGAVSVPTVQSPYGDTFSPGFTSPAEVWSWGAGLQALPTPLANIVRSAREHGHAGVILNPAGGAAVLPLAEL